MMDNTKSSIQETFEINMYILICCICYMICCVVPFNITDFYYSYYYPYSCIDISLINLNIRLLLKINGYAYIIFILYIILILTRYINFFENIVIMKTSVFIKVTYNIIWCILTTIIYSNIYNNCESDVKIYLMTRLCFLYIFIILSLKKIKSTLLED